MSKYSASTHTRAYPDYQRPLASEMAAYDISNYANKRSRHSRGSRKRNLLIALGVVVVLVILVAILGVTLVGSAKELKGQATEVLQDVSAVQSAIKENDYAKASSSAQHAAELTAGMKDELSSPAWSIASIFPVYGQDVSSVRSFVSAMNDALDSAIVPLVQSLEANPLDQLVSSDKHINVTALSQLLGSVQNIAPAMQECADVIEGLPAMHIEQLENVMGPAREKVIDINELVQRGAGLAPVIGTVLGASGDRAYLLVAQNSAEIRASGGFPGSMGLLEIRDGEIILGDFSTPYNLLSENTPESIGFSQEEVDIFNNMMVIARDAGRNPDFTRVAQIWAAAYEEKNARHVDGVISITPAVVQDILAFTGPIVLADGTELNGSNATTVLQHDLYWKYFASEEEYAQGAETSDALFAEAASMTFNKLFDNLNSETLMEFAKVMQSGMEDRTVMLWLTNADEQAALDPLDCSGALNHDPAKPEVGVFFSLTGGSKAGWYVDIKNEIVSSNENADGSRTYQMKTTYTNSMSQDDLATNNWYILGGYADETLGVLEPYLLIYAPCGGSFDSFEASGGDFQLMQHNGLQVYRAADATMVPGVSITCTYTVTTSTEADEELEIVCTPTLTEYRTAQ